MPSCQCKSGHLLFYGLIKENKLCLKINQVKAPMKPKIVILQTNITTLKVDAIVNAANSSLLGGGGVDGAIHRAAGRELVQECRLLGGCKTGQAKITKGYQLPARYIIHTVGPVWQGGKNDEARLLASCYDSCLQLAKKYQLQTIAFPAISCGAYGYPIEKATLIAFQATLNFLSQNEGIKEVIFACFSDDVYSAYLKEKDNSL